MTSYASSSSSTRPSQGYDVFISFRGEDTRMGFTSHLYDALTRKNITTYKDANSLELGNFIGPELSEAIKASKFAIVVLSSNFATSKWCLEEIAKIVECMEQGKLIVIPVFYHVTPSDVRHQSNCFEHAFANYEVDPEITPHKVDTWRAAFAKVGSISGLHVTLYSNESEVVCEIVRKILKHKQITLPMDFTDGLVGIESRANDVKRVLILESSEVRFIGICGMSGVGKTTLAEVVYGVIQNEFQESSFIENIKDISKEHDSDLCKLQQKLLDDILKDKTVSVRSVSHGQTLLKTKLQDLKVLIVLDDVNHADQLTYLAGGKKWFGNGTRIIITTTNIDLLNPHKINATYVCEELEGGEALRLLSQSAFEEEQPPNGYKKLCNDIVKLAGGLPLALNVYGSLLCGKEEKYWLEILKKLQEFPHKHVLGRLEIGYARLDRDQRDTFMFIACFLKGRDIDLVKDILSNIGLYPECGITDLINKFLITINLDDCVWMHDLLQQMCWEILRKESHRYDGKHIAIKSRQDVVDILSSKPKGSRTIEIINQEKSKIEVDDCVEDPSCFSKMKKLKFLKISNIHFPRGLTYLSNELRILEWYGCSLKSLPAMFEPKHIYKLEMCYSKLQKLWEKSLDMPNLRSVDLSFSKDLIKIPDLTLTPNLVRLNLEGCTKLRELHESVVLHKRLQYINLNGCSHLRSLGRSNMEMEALVTLLLSDCSNLEYIPEFGQNMKCLEHLYVDGTKIKKLPENLGKMFNLRKLDASETSIEEIPLSIWYLKRLRFLRAHRCPLTSQILSFPLTNVDIISSGLRELDLSYCNLSVIPDGIGLLSRLVNLDLSGNDFVSLPASISLLSNLRMLCLNDCKRMKSLPKLSVVNEDTLYGLQIRFNYIISRDGFDFSKFHATSNNISPTVSCLNCTNLAKNEHGIYLAEKVLNSYLQLRTKYWITPEAVFEIVGAGREFPSGFKLLKADENILIEGSWVGMAICAVFAVRHTEAFMDARYVETAHINYDDIHRKISVPVNFLGAGLDNQLVFYSIGAGDIQRILDSRQKCNFSFSFTVEPEDGYLQVTKFGVRFIRDGNILQLKRHEYSTIKDVRFLFQGTFRLLTDLQWYIRACEAAADLHSCHSIIHGLPSRIINFILDYGKQQDSLDGIHKIIKCLIELNHEVLSECKEDLKHTQLFPLVYDYFRINHGTSELYNDFVRLLKDVSCSWLSVKLALEQIVAKRRGEDYTYAMMLQQLNDLEASEGVRISDNFIVSFAYICKQIIVFAGHLNKEIEGNKKFKSVMTMAKISSLIIGGFFSILASYIGNDKLLNELKDVSSYPMWLHLIRTFSKERDAWFNEERMMISNESELLIKDFCGNKILLQELKNKMARFSCFTNEHEEEMRSIINKLEKNIVAFSEIIEDMNCLANNYGHEIRAAGVTLNQFIADGYLRMTNFGAYFKRDKDVLHPQKHEAPLSEVMSILYHASQFIPTDLQWYLRACGPASNLLSHEDHNHTRSIIQFIINYGKEGISLDCIHRISKRLHEINLETFILLSECKDEWRHTTQLITMVYDYYEICRGTYKIYNDFIRLLKDISDRWSSVKLALHRIEVNVRAGDYIYREILQKLNDLQTATSVQISDNFVKSFADLCKQTVAFARHFNEEIQEFKSVKVLVRASNGMTAGNFSVMAACTIDPAFLKIMKHMTLKNIWSQLIQVSSWKDAVWTDLRKLERMDRSYGHLVISDFYGSELLLQELKIKKSHYPYVTEEDKEGMMMVIDKLVTKIDNISETINDMISHAYKCCCDIKEAGINLDIKPWTSYQAEMVDIEPHLTLKR